ncbi:phospholipase A2 [Malassezia equina]|uniref:Lysophospholipase n=1 Tax=Malassezia equina TaxID=1381935 RepID=A0AAF0IYJ2_9BASI|nr:phospholipase A2 [Malassezia equina]
MGLVHKIRSSPSYLFLKCYLICTLVTLFAARPLSSRLNANGPWTWYESTEGGHGMSSWGRMQALLASATRRENRGEGTEGQTPTGMHSLGAWWQERRFPFLFPPPQIPLSLPPPVRLPRIPMLERWRLRWHDMSHLRRLVAVDDQDVDTFPELEWDAQVRCSSDLHADERSAIDQRRRLMSSEGTNALAHFLQLPEDEYVHPDDVPLIAIGGSGGGYRAMFGYAGFLKEAENTGLWQCTTWCSAVSGSCWTLAAYYTIAQCSTDVLIAHLLAMAHEEAHPMSLQAMDRVARSSRGIYYLLGPLLRKSRNKKLHCRIMDFYATLVLSYQFLPRPLALFGTDYSYNGPRANKEPSLHEHSLWAKYEPSEGLSRKSFQWSKVWERTRLSEGLHPIPILTGVRRVWRPYPVGDAPAPGPSQEGPPLVGSGYDWYEISPLELGCRSIGAWIPTWAYGRTFENGRSTHRAPEQMLATIVGQCTGAPAGPLTAYITTMLASIPQGTVMSTLLSWVNNFVKMKQWEKRWGNPIRAADEPNPFYGRGMDDVVIDMDGASPSVSPPPPAVTRSSPPPPPSQFSSKSEPPSQTKLQPPPPPVPPASAAPLPAADDDKVRPAAPINTFFTQLPRLPEFSLEHTLRPRRGSDASVSTSMMEHDPETFMAPMEELDVAHEDDDMGMPTHTRQWKWEHTRRLRLMDSGLSNNLPNHVLAREEREADVIISFDASSDVKTGAALERLHEFGREFHIDIRPRPRGDEPDVEVSSTAKAEAAAAAQRPSLSPSAMQRDLEDEAECMRLQYEHKYAQRLDGWRHKNGPVEGRDPDINFVYCPLLPNAAQPGFDPTTAHYSTSYNLIWTADQVRALLRTAMANVEEGSRSVRVIRETVREAYERRKKARLAREAGMPSVTVTGVGEENGHKRSKPTPTNPDPPMGPRGTAGPVPGKHLNESADPPADEGELRSSDAATSASAPLPAKNQDTSSFSHADSTSARAPAAIQADPLAMLAPAVTAA